MSPLLRSLVLVVFGLAAVATAADKPTPAERLKAVQKDVADAETAWRQAMLNRSDTDKPDAALLKLTKTYGEKLKAGFTTAFEIARADPKSDTAFRALEWLLMRPQTYYQPFGKSALELMAQHHAANPQIGKTIAILAYYPPVETAPPYRPAMKLLEAVAKKNPDRDARGNAALGLAWQDMRKFTAAEAKGSADVDALAHRAEKALVEVIREYGKCKNLRTMGARKVTATLADEAKTELYELRHLRIGRKAPNIDGEDLDGAKFKLSDYRGKAVLLVFWASWCGPCMAAVPHERELVEQFKGRPFALIGVNGDEKKESAHKAVAKYKINWRSFWNGKDGPGGPIATAWNVRGWPTVYVLDAQGVIRQKYLIDKQLDEPLEKLVAEAEASAKKSK